MDQEKMVVTKFEKKLVTKFREIIDVISLDLGNFALFMAIPEGKKRYTFILSAPWLDTSSPKEAILTLMSEMYKMLSQEQKGWISRITVINTLDPSVKEINRAFPVKNSLVRISNYELFNVNIVNAILFESNDQAE